MLLGNNLFETFKEDVSDLVIPLTMYADTFRHSQGLFFYCFGAICAGGAVGYNFQIIAVIYMLFCIEKGAVFKNLQI